MKEYKNNPEIGSCLFPLRNDYLIKQTLDEQIMIDGSDDDKKNLLFFFQAICLVDQNFIIYNKDELGDKSKESNDDSNKKDQNGDFYLERTFAYELYRQWQNILSFHNSPLRVDAEIGKKISQIGNLEELKKLKCESKEPDLVLHSSQDSTDNHIIACEIKRNMYLDSTKIKNDIEKLFKYMDKDIWDKHPYHYGCFIVIEKSFEELKNQILSKKDELIKYKKNVKFDNLICITYFERIIYYETLDKILGI